MNSVDFKPHKYKREGQVAVPLSRNDFVRFSDPNSDTKYFIQKGQVFQGKDKMLKKDEIPQWVTDKINGMNPKVLEQCGFMKPKTKAKVENMTDAERYDALLAQGLISEEDHAALVSVLPEPEPITLEPVTQEVTVEDIQAELASEVVPDEPEPTISTVDYSDMKRPDLLKACKGKEVRFSMSDTNDVLREKLAQI